MAVQMDLDYLLKLRLAVARHGEMDGAKWWNTKGLLGSRGKLVLKRGFPQTHLFAQARIVFEVARARCEELYADPNAVTLWSLPGELEDRFEARWQEWLASSSQWTTFFEELETPEQDLLERLERLGLLEQEHVAQVEQMQPTAQGNAVKLPASSDGLDDHTAALLAAGFARGKVGAPAIPFIQQ